MADNPRRQRPKNLNLVTIRLPLPALVSILHRLSGALLFLAIPLLLWLLQLSLASAESFVIVQNLMQHKLVKLICWLLAWAFLHHACAGIRHLLLDARWGMHRWFARFSSQAVLLVSAGLSLATGVWLW
ncbi:MAG: succinate dehydrogenase, cytochrome b556 subunit [Methylophilaceae bacterium]